MKSNRPGSFAAARQEGGFDINYDFIGHYRIEPVLTNGVDEIPIICNRNGCSIDPPPGVSYTILNGREYINGKLAYIHNKMVFDDPI